METEKQNYKVVEDQSLGDEYEKRYIVVDSETGEVLDNAQGYGYKSVQNAYKCFGYKSKHKNTKLHSRKTKELVKGFIKKHEDIFENLSEIMFISLKDGDEFSDEDIKNYLKENNIELPFSFAEFKRYF